MKLTIEVRNLNVYKGVLSELTNVLRHHAVEGDKTFAHTILKTLEILITGEVVETEAEA